MPMTGRVSHREIRDWYEAWNRRDWAAVHAFLRDDFQVDEAALGRCIQGAESYLRYARAWAALFPNAVLKVERISGSGNRGEAVVVEYICRGTQSRPWWGFAPSPAEVTFRFCDILHFEHDRLARCSTYGDYYRPLSELGHLHRQGEAA